MKTFQILGAAFMVLIPLLSYPMMYPSSMPYFKKQTSTSENEVDVNTVTMMKTESFKGLYLSFLIGTMIGLMIIGMTNNVGVELIHLSSRKVALLMSLFAAFNGIGRPIFGWLTDKLSHRAMLISYGLIIIAALLMLLAREGSIVLYSISFSIFWFNLGGWLAIAPTSTLILYGTKHYSRNYGVVFTAYGFGAIIGVYASGLLKDVFQSYDAVFYFIIVLCVLGAILSQRMLKDRDTKF